MNVISIFIVLQIALLFFMTFHDWIYLPPLTNIREIEKHSTRMGRLINSTIFFFLIFIPLALTFYYQYNFPLWALIIIATMYGILSIGTIASWWIPYFFGGYSKKYKENFVEYKKTHHFLSARGDNIIPNTFHMILHIQIWSCFALAMYLLLKIS